MVYFLEDMFRSFTTNMVSNFVIIVSFLTLSIIVFYLVFIIIMGTLRFLEKRKDRKTLSRDGIFITSVIPVATSVSFESKVDVFTSVEIV